MRFFHVVLVAAALIIFNTANAYAGTAYYVSPKGNDANSGLSPSTPWLTLAKINASTFSPGDHIYIDARNGPLYGCLSLTGYQVHSTVVSPLIIQPYNGVRWSIYSTCGATGNTATAAITVDSVQGLDWFR